MQYGQDTTSTHSIMRGGVLQLHRWGLLDDIIAAGTPPVRQTTFYVGDEQKFSIGLKSLHGVDALYAPRRTVLDPILADAAVFAGATVRFGVTVRGLTRRADGRVRGVVAEDEHGARFEATATIVVGADGLGSNVARWVDAPVERSASHASAFAYGYWTGLETEGLELYFRPGASAGAVPTNDGATCVFVGTQPHRFRRELMKDPMKGFIGIMRDAAPELVDRLPAAFAPKTPLTRFPGRPGRMRRAFGPGWALVGDAGYNKDPITAHGLTDALRDAELLARAIMATVIDGHDEAAALAEYQATRDRLAEDLWVTTDAIASYEWDATEIGALLMKVSAAMQDEVDHLAALDPMTVAI
jgi:2-polyprenyl-6-methoxyphenol hydroxylase-like FAD-dependent oxidoreductase